MRQISHKVPQSTFYILVLFSLKYPILEAFFVKENPAIRETKHHSTDADSSTDAIGGWTKNTQKPDFFQKQKKLPKMQKLKNV